MATDLERSAERGLSQPTAGRSAVDLATVLGILAAVILVAAAIVLGGSPGSFLDGPSVLIVFGGTFGVTTACFSVSDMISSMKDVGRTVFRTHHDVRAVAIQMLQVAQVARYRGILAIQSYLPVLEGQPMLVQGLSMVIDGTSGDEVERIMLREVQARAQRNARSVSILRKAAELSPAMGLIGTLVGLVQMLSNLEDPATIGPSMAVALLTTFYGACLANMVFNPLASKLERNAAEDMLTNHLCVTAAASIGRQENPRRLEMLFNTMLPPSRRVDYFG
ncbi:flagellar motor protein MotA [Hwanghaeella grinnelliae]|uniref:Flagellar motor protein MotA n=1 Tax=Hwanghaeella grinnelliae TaxID=2500179 RepID=A0A3S2ZB58_9PROT|nr:MotA/TolQ/ExbB proton channel family protein [Hwanghaeella grinnelliae]RVU38524.1 flagellar motor protein MotA [Hwanghaeella grinnelliae]